MTTSKEATALSTSERRSALIRRIAPGAVLVLVVVGISMFESNFLTIASFQALLRQAPVLLMLALGQMLVILTGRIDLSNASLASLAGILTVLWLDRFGLAAVLLVVLVTTIAGAIQGVIHYYGQVASFVVTLGGLGAWAGLALAITQGHSVIDSTDLLDWLYEDTFGVENAVYIGGVVALLLAGVLRRLYLGRAIFAIGNGQVAASFSGVKVGRILVIVFALSGAFAGLAGVLIIAWLGAASPSTANNLLLPGLAAVIVGGTAITGGLGGVGRTILGVLIMAVLRVGLDVAGIPAAIQPIVFGSLTILAVGLTLDRSRLQIVK